MVDIEKLTKSDIVGLIGQGLMHWQVSWSNYDRRKIVETLKTNGYVFSIVSKIARSSTKIEWVIGNTINNQFQADDKNRLYRALKYPNPLQSEKEFKQAITMQYFSFGECFIYFDRYDAGNNKGEIIKGSMFLAPPDIVDIKHERYIPTGYVVNGDVNKTIPLENMIHIRAFNPDYKDLHGLPYIAVAGTLIDKLNAANETETKTFQNSGPAVLVSASETDSFSDEQYLNFIGRLKKAWRNVANKRGIVGTSGKVNVHQLGMSPNEMGTIESQKNTTRILLVLWGLDPGLFDTDASTYNNKKTIEQSVYNECAIPFMELFTDKINQYFSSIYKAEFRIDTSQIEALQPNYVEKVQWMIDAGVFTDNEIRDALNYDMRDTDVSETTPNERMQLSAIEGFEKEELDNEIVK